MKKSILSIFLILLGLESVNAQYVGINTNTPAAALDIKSKTDNGSEVMRFSTIPSKLDKSKEFVLFAGEKVGEGYNLRKVSLDELFSVVGIYIPITKRIVVTNSTKQTFPYGIATYITLDQEVYNSGNQDYEFNARRNEIKILKEGYYDITSWIGFERITAQQENDVLLILNKKSATDTQFSETRATIVSRSNTPFSVQVGNGAGASFAFVDKFEKGDVFKLSVRSYLENVNTLPKSVSFTITRVDKEKVDVVNLNP